MTLADSGSATPRREGQGATGGFATVRVDTLEEYAALATAVTAEPGAALPVFAANADDLSRRVEGVLRSAGSGTPDGQALGVPRAGQWIGEVVVLDAGVHPVAEVLARATGRPLRVLEGATGWADALATSRTRPVTVVALVSSVSPADLAAIPNDAQLGLVLARTVEGAAALVARTVLLGPVIAPAGGGGLLDLSYDALGEQPTGPGHLGQEVSPSLLRTTLGEGIGVLAGRGHGRDCLAHLNGGGICGRSAEPSGPSGPVELTLGGWSEHPTACQQGETCWRDDLMPADHLRAQEVAATVVVLDSCRTAVAGAGAVGPEVSLPLSLLEGTAIAAAAPVGTRAGITPTGQLFTALARGGHSLGAALAEMNGVIAGGAEGIGRLVLFGDAGLVPAPQVTPATPRSLDDDMTLTVPVDDGAVLLDTADVLPLHPDGPVVLRRRDGRSAWLLTGIAGRTDGTVRGAPPELGTFWTGVVRGWMDRVANLPWQGVAIDRPGLDDLRRTTIASIRARASAPDVAAAEQAADRFDEVVRQLIEHQREVVAERTAEVASTFFAAIDAWPEPFQVDTRPEILDCPQCGLRALTDHRVTPAGGAGVELSYQVCARCGEVYAGDPALSGVRVVAPAEARLGAEFEVSVELANPGRLRRHVAVGAAALHEQRFGCRLASTAEAVVAPGETRKLTFTGTSDPAVTLPDLQAVKVIVMADGVLGCLTRNIWMRR